MRRCEVYWTVDALATQRSKGEQPSLWGGDQGATAGTIV